MLGIIHDTLEVYTLESCIHIQTVPNLSKARLICRCKQGKVYVASMSNVWCISATDFSQQIRILLEQSQFQLALKLTVSLNCQFSEFIKLVKVNIFTYFY